MIYHRLIIILIVCTWTYDCYATNENYFSFHSVVEQCNDCELELYDYGRDKFKNYKFHWLPDSFLIKKYPDYKLYPSDINEIIIKQFEIPRDNIAFFVSIKLKDSSIDDFQRYLLKNNNTKVAIKTDNKILNIVTMKVEPNIKGITFSVRDISEEELVCFLRKLSKNVNGINSKKTNTI